MMTLLDYHDMYCLHVRGYIVGNNSGYVLPAGDF